MRGSQTLRVDEVAGVFNGKTPSKAQQRDAGHSVLKIKDVDALGRFRGTFSGHVDPELAQKHTKQQIRGGETLILNAAHSATHVASKTYFTDAEVKGSLATGEWLMIRWNQKATDPRYGHHWINAPQTRFRIRRLVNGIHLYPRDVARLQIPLPPLAEQKRIAGILDAADALRAKRRESLAQLDTLLQSTFLDMFGDPVTNPMAWPINALSDLCLGITDIDHKMPKSVESGIPFISAKDLADDGSISFENAKHISNEDFVRLSKKGRPLKGDILYSRIGTVGKARCVEVDFDFLASYSCCTIKPNQNFVSTRFLCALLDSPFMLRRALAGVRGIAVPDLGLGTIRAFSTITPPLELQHRFSGIVKFVEQHKASQRAHLHELDTLFASLQSRAFCGDL